MKRLIDAYALIEYVQNNAAFFVDNPCAVADFVKFAIKAQETVICVSDDFGPCKKELHCEDIMCGGACCEEP